MFLRLFLGLLVLAPPLLPLGALRATEAVVHIFGFLPGAKQVLGGSELEFKYNHF